VNEMRRDRLMGILNPPTVLGRVIWLLTSWTLILLFMVWYHQDLLFR